MHDPKYDDMKRSSSVYRVYGEENNVKEMKGHHLMRWLQGDAVHSDGHGHEDLNAHVHEDGLTDGEHIDFILLMICTTHSTQASLEFILWRFHLFFWSR